MNYTICKLAENYRHPMRFKMGGYWGLFEDGRLMVVDKDFSPIFELKATLDQELNRTESDKRKHINAH